MVFNRTLYLQVSTSLKCICHLQVISHGTIAYIKSLENKTTNNFVNESYLFTQISYIIKTYTTTAREQSIYVTKFPYEEIELNNLGYLSADDRLKGNDNA